MGDYTARFTELHYPLLIEPCDAFTPATVASAWISMEDYHRGVLVFNVGDMTAGDRVDVWLQEATTVGGAGGKNIAGKTFTVTQAGGDANAPNAIELQTEEMDVANRFDFIRVVVRTLGTSTEYGWLWYGIEPRYAATPIANWNNIIP